MSQNVLDASLEDTSLATSMLEMGKAARLAARHLAFVPTAAKNAALYAAAKYLRSQQHRLVDANALDLALAKQKGLSESLCDRLTLTPGRIEAMAQGMEAIASLEDPIGKLITSWQRPNGLVIERRRVPLGVIGIIFESRPNVVADAGALCLKSGNAAILRAGGDSYASAQEILRCLALGLEDAGLPLAAIQLVPSRARAAVGVMLEMDDMIDVIIPRGGRSLIERVATQSRIPVLKHLDGLCHVYIDKAADLEIACEVAFNAKMRRTSVCGAMETLLVHEQVVHSHLPPLIDKLLKAGCELRADATICRLHPAIIQACQADWDTEYLAAILSIKTVSNLEEAISHIEQHGSHHTDSIITQDQDAAQKFVEHVDSAIVLVNASTQFADGAEFGMGAEIGISTGKLHARGPVGVEQLTSYKYVVKGTGQCRPL
jgi:glutamate-5-semialdehyde dehydrogenase